MSLEIFLPFYGSVPLLKEAVLSVVAQTDKNWTLTVLDDCYPSEEPAAWVAKIGDPRIKFIRNPENMGITGNFNQCIKLATQSHMVIMGGDDLMLPSFVESANRNALLHPEAAFIQTGVSVIDHAGANYLPLSDRIKALIRPKSNTPLLLESQKALESLLLGNWLYFPSIIWNTQILKLYLFDSSYSIVQDLKLITEILLGGGKLLIVPETTFKYRRHSESLSSKGGGNAKRYFEEASFFNEIAPRLRLTGHGKAARRARLHVLSRLAALIELITGVTRGLRTDKKSLLTHIFLS
jgi:glycosyltransferase involved in cell wall biosynthesis